MKHILLFSAVLFLFASCRKTYVTVSSPSFKSYVRDSINYDTVKFNENSSIQYITPTSKNNTFYLDTTSAIAGCESTVMVKTMANDFLRAYNSGSVYNNSYISLYSSYVVIRIKYLGVIDNIPTFDVAYTNPKP